MKEPILTYTKLVRAEDMNPADTLFGGRLLQWTDEAAAIYVMEKLGTKKVVTLKISETIFKKPVKNGDILKFYATTVAMGKTSSITIQINVYNQLVDSPENPTEVFSCQMIFVAVDNDGKPVAHGK